MECQLEGMTMHYEMMGEGRPIIMLHGRPCDHRYMVSDMEPLFAQRPGWKRIYPELPGMGKTAGANWISTQDHMLEVVLDFIDTIIPGERFVVVGASYGGYLARGLIYRRLALIDGLLLTAPLIQPDVARCNLPTHRTLVEDLTILTERESDLVKDFQGFAVVQSKKFFDYM